MCNLNSKSILSMLFDLMMIGFVELGGITELQNLNSNVVFITFIVMSCSNLPKFTNCMI